MKKVIKIILIVIGAIIGLSLVINLFIPDEKKAEYEKERLLRDSLKVAQDKNANAITKRKVSIFNDIDSIINYLSLNGIGQLHTWKSDETGGWFCCTDYYKLNENSYGLSNNIAYYLESDYPHCIKNLKLVLNVNDESNYDDCMKFFRDLTNKTFESISLSTPDAITAAINERKETVFENEKFISRLELDKGRIDTWKLNIESK